ncbi:MAG: hypothetical protein A2Z59_02255 [Nitrospinae bacterium RIFCSPLOWO2_02_39_17]|nr:MAG: hypothetical protein A2Z59_02255 [Nitrospinae bacterium RIFCSPLOWO2_02_39_17]
MIVAIHQPQFIPWLGYFDKIDQADVFIFLDNVQYKKNEYQNRNRIKTANGWQWLTVPVLYKFPQKINEVRINNKIDWKRKHLNTLVTNYSKSKYFEKYILYFKALYSKEWEFISDINIDVTRQLAGFLGIKKNFIIASEFLSADKEEGDATKRLIDICRLIGADTYLAGKDGAKYMDVEKFTKSGIKLTFQDFKHPVYSQLFRKFEPNMSVIDLLFNHGEESIEIIRKYRGGL